MAKENFSNDPLAKGGVRRYLDTVKPEEYLPDVGEVSLAELSLTGLADLYGSDKGTLKHYYTVTYAQIIEDMLSGANRQQAKLNIVEFGVACGASLRMWANYLPSSHIYGVDIREDCLNLCKDLQNVTISINDVTKPGGTDFLAKLTQVDIIVDDASHISEDIVLAFQNSWKYLGEGGYYIIEDLRCTYNPEYTANFRKNFSQSAVNDRQVILRFVDWLMRQIDSRSVACHFLYHPELIVIKKLAKSC